MNTYRPWEEPTLHPYPVFNAYTGATHNPDGTREVCSGPNNDKCRTVGGNIVNNWWGGDEKTKNPYPPTLSMGSLAAKTFNEEYSSNDGSVHNNDGSRTVVTSTGGRKVTDKHQIKLNFGLDPRAAHGANALAEEEPAAPASEKPRPIFNPYDGVMHNPDGSRTVCTGVNLDSCRVISDKN